jgi:hypothetical protein
MHDDDHPMIHLFVPRIGVHNGLFFLCKRRA